MQLTHGLAVAKSRSRLQLQEPLSRVQQQERRCYQFSTTTKDQWVVRFRWSETFITTFTIIIRCFVWTILMTVAALCTFFSLDSIPINMPAWRVNFVDTFTHRKLPVNSHNWLNTIFKMTIRIWCWLLFTAHLLREVLNVDPELLRILNPDVPITVNGVEITCIDVPR